MEPNLENFTDLETRCHNDQNISTVYDTIQKDHSIFKYLKQRTPSFSSINLDTFTSKDANLTSIIDFFLSKSYTVLYTIENPSIESFSSPISGYEVQFNGLPVIHSDLASYLSKEHPGIRFKRLISLKDVSQHNVDILSFEYQVDGKIVTMDLIGKTKNPFDVSIPLFLQNIGVKTSNVLDLGGTRLYMQSVGVKDLREIINQSQENDSIAVCERAMHSIAQIQILGTKNISLLGDLRAKPQVADYVKRFNNYFVNYVSRERKISTIQEVRLMQAYATFSRFFNPITFLIGDAHPGNFRADIDPTSGKTTQIYRIDFETAEIGERFSEPSRFVNSAIRERFSSQSDEFTRYMFHSYVTMQNNIANEEGTELIIPSRKVETIFRFSMINDELYKVGEYIAFANSHEKVKDEKLQKSADCLDNSLSNLTKEIDYALTSHDSNTAKILYDLKVALIDYVASITPYELLAEVSRKHRMNQSYCVSNSSRILRVA